MEDKIFILTFDRGSGNCHDEEYRICKAKSAEEAEKIACKYYEKHYGKHWRLSFWEAEWCEDNTAYVTSSYS
jgi:hypothetical protein